MAGSGQMRAGRLIRMPSRKAHCSLSYLFSAPHTQYIQYIQYTQCTQYTQYTQYTQDTPVVVGGQVKELKSNQKALRREVTIKASAGGKTSLKMGAVAEATSATEPAKGEEVISLHLLCNSHAFPCFAGVLTM